LDDEAVSRYKFPNDSSIPIAYLTCNFTAPINNKPSTLTHDEVITLFHEFGHGLHHLLTEIDEYSISGIKGVEWDAVELPSQFMENFCWEWEVVKNMAHHIDTKEKMPKNLFDKLFLSKNFQSGLQTLRQVEFALFDMILHESDPVKNYDYIAKNCSGSIDETLLLLGTDFIDRLKSVQAYNFYIPRLMIIIAKYQYTHAFVLDKMTNLLACIFEIQTLLTKHEIN